MDKVDNKGHFYKSDLTSLFTKILQVSLDFCCYSLKSTNFMAENLQGWLLKI